MKWPLVPLGSLCQFLNGGTPSKEVTSYFDGVIPWITGADITSSVVKTARSFITDEAIKKSATSLVEAGTVLLVTRTSVGKVAVAGVDLCFSQDITALIPDHNRLDAGYLVCFLRNKEAHFKQFQRGATIQGITRDVVTDLKIPLPPLAEQQRIAALLDKADALRHLRRDALSHLDRLLQSVFVEMFGDPVTNPKDWEVVKLGSVILSGPQNGLYKPSTDYGTGTLILRIDSFYNGQAVNLGKLKRVKITETEAEIFKLSEQDIVINRVNSRSHLGKSGLIPALSEPTVFESNMMRMTVDVTRLAPTFLIHLLQTDFVKRQIMMCAKDAVNQSSINQQDVKGFDILVPPLPLQERFAAVVGEVENLRACQLTAQTHADALFAALQARAFAGAG